MLAGDRKSRAPDAIRGPYKTRSVLVGSKKMALQMHVGGRTRHDHCSLEIPRAGLQMLGAGRTKCDQCSLKIPRAGLQVLGA